MKLKLIISILFVSISNNCLSNNDDEACQQRSFDNQIIVDISEQKLYLHCNYANGVGWADERIRSQPNLQQL